MNDTAQGVKERPIIFSGSMPKLIIDGLKTQTRRPMKPQPPSLDAVKALSGTTFSIFSDGCSWPDANAWRVAGPVWAVRELMGCEPQWRSPHGAPGDRLWVRENYYHGYGRTVDEEGTGKDVRIGPVVYADEREISGWLDDTQRVYMRKVPSIHMPRWASRITLEIIDVRVERLLDITPHDALAEGARYPYCDDVSPDHRAVEAFLALWDSLYVGTEFASENDPWVWAYTFKRLTPTNIDGSGNGR